jgi:hypothetical protein
MSISIGAKGTSVPKIQQTLAKLGLDVGPIDGVFGKRTRKALVEFQRAKGLVADGILGPVTRDALGLDVELHVPETTRTSFHALIKSNPNYFGTLPNSPYKAVVAQSGNTSYEQLVCLGYEPIHDRLEAVVLVKLTAGYGGPLCSGGSREYVRFFIDWNNDGNWTDLGVSSFAAHDIPFEGVLHYSVHVPLDPGLTPCFKPRLPKVRAILSWNDEPPRDDPNYVPPWGNALDTTIQLPAYKFALLEPGLDLELSKAQLESLAKKLPVPELGPVLATTSSADATNVSKLAKHYANSSVPAERFAASYLKKLVMTKSSAEIAALAPEVSKILDLDLGALIEKLLAFGDGNQSYEELRCVGYDRERRSLNAVIKIKQPLGYGGDLCSTGSREYVGFWYWDTTTGAWQPLGTASIPVFDLEVPTGGIDYAVYLPIDLSALQKPCSEGPTLVQIRAILSWNSPPSGPNDVPYWGGREQGWIEVKPGPTVPVGQQRPFLETVGTVDVCDIDMATGLASSTSAIDDAPFGRCVTITGFFTNPPQTLSAPKPRYRVSVRPFDPTNTNNPWQPLTNNFTITTTTVVGSNVGFQTKLEQTIDSQGYYTYQEVIGVNTRVTVADNKLAEWHTPKVPAIYEILVEGMDAMGNPMTAGLILCDDGSTRQTVNVMLDNEVPSASLTLTGVIPSGESAPVPAKECGKFKVGDKLIGQYSATDDHFSRCWLTLSPDPTPGVVPKPAPVLLGAKSYAGGLAPNGEPGAQWELDTTGMRPCGYTLTLHVYDRTIVGNCANNNWHHWKTSRTIGFCLEPAD